MPVRTNAWLLSLVAWVLACEGPLQIEPKHNANAPRLVVVIVLDQVGSWVLSRHLPSLPEDGILRRIAREGAYHERVRLGYAATLTAPGHALIYTGAFPAISGVSANQYWDTQRRRVVPAVDDGRSQVLGCKDAYASPAVLLVDGVADRLRAATLNRGRVVSLSLKDRGAVMAGGRRPDLVLWYEEEPRGFTTSTYYAKRLPAWLDAWQKVHPVEKLFSDWRPSRPDLLRKRVGFDDAPGESDWMGFGTVFPHRVGKTTDPYTAVVATPQSTAWLLDLGIEATKQFDLGTDAYPDLLGISISGTDYIGHLFGPESWEALDNLIKVDRALKKFIDALQTRGSVAFLITADHGVTPLVEKSVTRGQDAHRLPEKYVAAQVESALDRQITENHWVESYVAPFLYLSPYAKAKQRRALAVRLAIRALKNVPGIAEAFDVREVRQHRNNKDLIRRMVALSIDPQMRGDLYVVTKRYSTVAPGSAKPAGTNHGSPWAEDTDIPVLMWGDGVERVHTQTPQDARRVAATISALLGISAPSSAIAHPLPGVNRLGRSRSYPPADPVSP